MKQPHAFLLFTGGYYEEIFYEAETLEGIVRLLLERLSPAQKGELLVYLDHLAATLTASEIRGILRRANRGMWFGTRMAMEVIETAAAQIRESLRP